MMSVSNRGQNPTVISAVMSNAYGNFFHSVVASLSIDHFSSNRPKKLVRTAHSRYVAVSTMPHTAQIVATRNTVEPWCHAPMNTMTSLTKFANPGNPLDAITAITMHVP